MCETCLLAWWGCDPNAAAAVSALLANGNTLLRPLEEAERVVASRSQGPAWADDFWQQVQLPFVVARCHSRCSAIHPSTQSCFSVGVQKQLPSASLAS